MTTGAVFGWAELGPGWAELDPGFAKSRILPAVSKDGKPFDDAAGPHLVVPQDTHGGRYVSEVNQL
ncbi:hypothetical protein [Streptomyces sp. NPDC056525]|uniref:hypothetical protein n=1 Tax=unclassified Streptomyces TaxID=2593676 RepID=UPI003695FEA9